MLYLAMADFPHKNANHPVYIWEWRKNRGMTTEKLAEAAGMQRSLLSQLETGSRRVNADHITAIAGVFGIHPGDLFRSPEDPINELRKHFDNIPEHERPKALKLLLAFASEPTEHTE